MDSTNIKLIANDDTSELDMELLNQHFNGDDDFKFFFLNLAIDEIQKSIVQIQGYKTKGNSEELKGFLHKLKGTVASVGLLKVTEKVAECEHLISGVLDVQDILNDLENELNKGLLIIKTIK